MAVRSQTAEMEGKPNSAQENDHHDQCEIRRDLRPFSPQIWIEIADGEPDFRVGDHSARAFLLQILS